VEAGIILRNEGAGAAKWCETEEKSAVRSFSVGLWWVLPLYEIPPLVTEIDSSIFFACRRSRAVDSTLRRAILYAAMAPSARRSLPGLDDNLHPTESRLGAVTCVFLRYGIMFPVIVVFVRRIFFYVG
jgi:hypothetical protein